MNNGEQIRGQQLFFRQSSRTSFNGPCIICDGIQTPENFGAILRIADATGSCRIILLDSELDLNSRKLSKLARSCEKHLQIEHQSLDEFIKTGNTFSRLLALEITTHSQNLFTTDVSQCDAIVIGHESSGIRHALLSLCAGAIHLPMFGINGSMNLSHALAVFLYEWRRQQHAL